MTYHIKTTSCRQASFGDNPTRKPQETVKKNKEKQKFKPIYLNKIGILCLIMSYFEAYQIYLKQINYTYRYSTVSYWLNMFFLYLFQKMQTLYAVS